MHGAIRAVGILLVGVIAGCATPEGATTAEKQAYVRQMRSDTLDQLYDIHPIAREQIQTAEGYAVFSNIGINLLLLSTANGFGVVHDKHSGADTYMRMWSGGVGIGLGAKDFRGVFVLPNVMRWRALSKAAGKRTRRLTRQRSQVRRAAPGPALSRSHRASSYTKSRRPGLHCRRQSRAPNTGRTKT